MWIRMNGLPLCGVGCERISPGARRPGSMRSEEHTSELQSRSDLVCRLLLEKKKKKRKLPITSEEKKTESKSRPYTICRKRLGQQTRQEAASTCSPNTDTRCAMHDINTHSTH